MVHVTRPNSACFQGLATCTADHVLEACRLIVEGTFFRSVASLTPGNGDTSQTSKTSAFCGSAGTALWRPLLHMCGLHSRINLHQNDHTATVGRAGVVQS